MKYIQADHATRVMNCPECRSPQLKVKGDRIIITKGAPDLSTLVELGKQQEVEAFLTLEVHKTRLSMITHATLFQTGSGQVMAAETFKTPDIDFTESAMLYTLSFGPGLIFGRTTNPGATSPPLNLEISLLEELNFGKGGLTVGTLFNSDTNNYYYLMPTLGLRSRMGRSSFHSLTTLAAGFGTGSAGSGVALSGGFNLFLASFTYVGVKVSGLVPLSSTETRGLLGSAALEIGVALGK